MSAAAASKTNEAVYTKIAIRLMPFIMACYVIGYLDRSSLGVAKLQFMHELGIGQYVFGLITSSFYIGYILFDVPSNMLLHKIGAPKTFMRIMVLWGAVTMSMMFATNATWLFVQRILLGTFEAGFFPGVVLYLTYWFPDRLRAKAISLFIVGMPLSGIIGGAITGPVMEGMDGVLGLHGWQWLFLVAGGPAILLGLLCPLWLIDKPANARFLSEAERKWVQDDLEANRREVQQKPSVSALSALVDWRVWVLGVCYCSISFYTSSNQVWFPTALKAAGVESLAEIGGLLTGIWTVTAVGVLVISRLWNRSKERRVQFALCGLTAAASYLVLPLVPHEPLLLAAILAVGATAGYSAYVVFWTIPPRFMEGPAAAVGIGMVTMMGSVGPLLSPILVGWTAEATDSVYAGLASAAAVTTFGMILALIAIPRLKPELTAQAAVVAA